MGIIGGHLPHLPPTPRATPHGTEDRRHERPPVTRGAPPRDWTGWVSPSGLLRALRRGAHRGKDGYAWVFLCLLCGHEKELLPSRIRQGDVHTCGCGPRGMYSPRIRSQRLAEKIGEREAG